MPKKPASLDEIRSALGSPDLEVRIAGLRHAQALGAEAASLAPEVARCIDDPDDAVAWHVPRAFAALGRGAAEAVDVLVPMLSGGSEMRRSRALFCLGAIGPVAQPAIPAILALSRGEADLAHDAIEALIGLAGPSAGGPVDEDIAARALAAARSKDYGRSSAAARELARAPEWLRLRALDDLDARMAPEADGAVLLCELAPVMPERAMSSILRALGAGGTAGRMAALALERAPGPIPPAALDALFADAAKDPRHAETLARIAPRIASPAVRVRAIATLGPALKKATGIRHVAELAGALAALAPGSATEMPHLLRTFERARRPAKGHTPYDLGALAEAIGALADATTAEDAAVALAAAVPEADAMLAEERSTALDLHRALKTGLTALSKRSPAAKKAARRKTVADAVDARHAREDRARARPSKKLAPIPKARPKRPPVELEALTAEQRGHLRSAIARGRTHLLRRLTSRSSADTIASAVDATLAFARDRPAQAKTTPRMLGDIAALYGDAIVRAARWRWCLWRDGAHVTYAVVSPKKTYAVLPIELVIRQSKPRVELTLLLLFRMIVAKNLPAPREGDPIVLG